GLISNSPVNGRPEVSNLHTGTDNRLGAGARILERSLSVRTTLRKTRAVFLLVQTRIHLDDVADLGAFVDSRWYCEMSSLSRIENDSACGLFDAFSIPVANSIARAYVDFL